MGTGFDDVTQKVCSTYNELPIPVLANRTLLKYTMEKHGLLGTETEWSTCGPSTSEAFYHFVYKDWWMCPYRDVPLKILAKDES